MSSQGKGAPRDTEAFMDLVRRHDHGLRMLTYRLLHDRAAVDDVMQDAYLKAFRGLSGFRGEAQARTWLYRIVYNACVDSLRSDRGLRELPLDLESCEDGCFAAAPGTMQPAEVVPGKIDLARALALLPPDHRAAVLLVDAAGFSYDEAAQVLGVRPGTIASRLHHARSALRETLVEKEER